MPFILGEVLLHDQDSAALGAAQSLLRILTSDDRYATAVGSTQTMQDALNKLGFSGLWQGAFARPGTEKVKQECFELTAKLVEVRELGKMQAKSRRLIDHSS